MARVGTHDVENMERKDLRKLALSLGVGSRGSWKSDKLLRTACQRAPRGQTVLARFFAPGAPSQESLGPEVGVEAGGAAPVSDSPREVAPDRTSKPKHPRVARLPTRTWLRHMRAALVQLTVLEANRPRGVADMTLAVPVPLRGSGPGQRAPPHQFRRRKLR